MEATYDKNNTNSAFDNDASHFKFSNMDDGLNISSDMPESHDLEEHQMISSPTLAKNNYNESNNVHINDKSTDVVDHHQRFVDDFGPETDVDAMDDSNATKYPADLQTNDSINEYNLSNGVKPISLENKIIQQLSEQNQDFLNDNNPFKNDHFDQFNDDQVMLDQTIAKIPSPSPMVDNKIIDALESLAVSNGDQEKCELECEKQMDDLLDVRQKSPEMPDFEEKADYIHEKNLFSFDAAADVDDTFTQHSENAFDQTIKEDALADEKVDTELADTACVEESVGEDTEEEEDEWNYIKGDKKSENSLLSPTVQETHNTHDGEAAQNPTLASELVETVNDPVKVPTSDIVHESELLDLSSETNSAEKGDSFEQEKEDVDINEEAVASKEIVGNVTEEDFAVIDTSVESHDHAEVLNQEELANLEDCTSITSPIAVTPIPSVDIIHTPLSEDQPVDTEPNPLEEEVSAFVTEDKPLDPVATVQSSAELIAEDTSSLEVPAEDTTQSTDIEHEIEPVIVTEKAATVENEAPTTQQPIEDRPFSSELETSVDEELERPNSLSLEMASKLNPEAKEFVPVSSPSRSNPTSPVTNAPAVLPNSYLMLDDDTVVAQSPKKCTTTMDNIDVPEEDDFQVEMNNRPHELEKPSEYTNGNAEISARSHSPASEPSYQELNLKEAMQADEKLEHDYNDEKLVGQEDTSSASLIEQNILNVLNKEQDPMNMSFYEGRDEALLSNSDELNKVHVLPEVDDVEESANDDVDKVPLDVSEPVPIPNEPAEHEMSDDKTEIVESESAPQLNEEPHIESKSPVQEEPTAAIFAVASQVVNDVAALVDQMQIDTAETEIKQQDKVQLEAMPAQPEDVLIEPSRDILISLEKQNEIKPFEDTVDIEQGAESPRPMVTDENINIHSEETEELVSPLVESLEHEVMTENEFITDESVLNVPSPLQPAFSAEAPVEYECEAVEKSTVEATTQLCSESMSKEIAAVDTTTINLLDIVAPILAHVESTPKVIEDPKPTAVASKSTVSKVAPITKSAATNKTLSAKPVSKPSTATTDRKTQTSAKVPPKTAPTKSTTTAKPTTAVNAVKKSSTVTQTSTTTSRSVGVTKPSTAPTTTRTSLAAASANKTAADKKAPLATKKPTTSVVNGEAKAAPAARKPLASTTLRAATATKSATTTGSSSSATSARLSGSTVKPSTAKPLSSAAKSTMSAPAKLSTASSRTTSTVSTAKPRSALSTAAKTASVTSTSTVASKTSQVSTTSATKRISTIGASRTVASSKTTTTVKTSAVASQTSTASKGSIHSTTSATARKTTTTSPAKKLISSPAAKTTTKLSATGKTTTTATKVVVSNHVNNDKVPLTADPITDDLLNMDKQLKNDNNQLITKNGIDSQMMVIDSAAD